MMAQISSEAYNKKKRNVMDCTLHVVNCTIPEVRVNQSVSSVIGVSTNFRNSTSAPSACKAILPLLAVALNP